MKIIAGHCGKCGAPYYTDMKLSDFPSPPKPTCVCWNIPTETVTTGNSLEDVMNQLKKKGRTV